MTSDHSKVLYWNEGFPVLRENRRWRRLGRMYCKGNVQTWCRRYGIRFYEALPWDWNRGVKHRCSSIEKIGG